jgi:transcriptional regulator with XRE-family HTH domain
MPRSKIDATDKHVGKQVCMRRLMLGMTIEALGNAVGVTYQQMYKCEKGLNRIGASRLRHIAQILEVPISFFFKDAPVSTKEAANQVPDYTKEFLATRDGLELAKAFSRIEKRNVRRAIVELVEQIVPE